MDILSFQNVDVKSKVGALGWFYRRSFRL